ncbi:hypothetical protein BC828DRAFT_373170 [Blastocladiella britannica]|nr:hypothetical protein BC828DRAFT_373170 [Blastocladiella britannica]
MIDPPFLALVHRGCFLELLLVRAALTSGNWAPELYSQNNFVRSPSNQGAVWQRSRR